VHFFPNQNEPALRPFVDAFLHVMFAHAEFERRVSELMGVITKEPTFGEQRKNQLAYRKPEQFGQLITRHFPDGLHEADAVVDCLKCAETPCRERNLLAHGAWWKLEGGSLSVRSMTTWPGEDQLKMRAAGDIEWAASRLEHLEAKLYELQRSIERQYPDPDLKRALDQQ
jgi:hypothetical protein